MHKKIIDDVTKQLEQIWKDKETLKKEIIKELNKNKKESRIAVILKHPLLLLLVGSLFTGILGTWLNAEIQSQQLKTQNEIKRYEKKLEKKILIADQQLDFLNRFYIEVNILGSLKKYIREVNQTTNSNKSEIIEQITNLAVYRGDYTKYRNGLQEYKLYFDNKDSIDLVYKKIDTLILDKTECFKAVSSWLENEKISEQDSIKIEKCFSNLSLVRDTLPIYTEKLAILFFKDINKKPSYNFD